MSEATNNGFSACDMATAAAQGFRDGVASVRPVPPAAAFVMPERKTKMDFSGYIENFQAEASAIYNSALDEVARLNAGPVEHVRAMVPSVEQLV